MLNSCSTSKLCFILFVSINCLHVCTSARILAALGANMRSHLNAFATLLEHLAPYHDITFVLDPQLKYKYPNITNVHVPAQTISHAVGKKNILENPCEIDYYTIYYYHVLHDDENYYHNVYSNENFQNLLQSDQKFDVFIMSSYGSDHLAILAHKFNIPIIQVSPSLLLPWTNIQADNPNNWDDEYSFVVDEHTDSLKGRITKYIKNFAMLRRYYSVTISNINKIAKGYLPGAPPVQELIMNTELVFVNLHNAMGFPRTVATTIVEVGGMHVKTANELKGELEGFISGAGDDGFVYFSLGTFISESKLQPDMLRAMLNTFGKLKQRVLWKWDGDMDDVPPNVKISKWFPQQDLLAHKNIKLFISQGGMLSLLESSSVGVPVLIMPAIFDQKINGYLAKKLGYGLVQDFCDFTENVFHERITDLINNPKYKEQAMQISKVMQHDRKSVKDKINFWVDFVIEHKGKSILKETSPYTPWTQRIAVDVFLVLASFVILSVSVVIYFCILVKRWVVQKNKKVKTI